MTTISSQLKTITPDWYVSPEDQLARIKQLNKERKWGFKTFPEVPEFTPQTDTEVLLLAVYLKDVQTTFDEHLAVIEEQVGLYKWDDYKVELHAVKHRPGLRWVAYDYAANWSKRSGKDLWDKKTPNLAASEILSAVMLFPDYVKAMDGVKFPYVDLAGYKMAGVGFAQALFLDWNDIHREAGLRSDPSVHVRDYCAAPSLREL